MRLVLLLCCAILAWGEESAAIATFKQAMAGDDFGAKRDAINALVSKDAGDDDTILPLLVATVGDRQGREPAIAALRARTGLSPGAPGNTGYPGYPGYPRSDAQNDWQAWLDARAKDMETRKQIKKLEKEVEKKEGKPDAAPTEEKPAEEAPVAPPPRIPTDDLGKADRIVYKSGRSLIAFVRSKRLDGDGNLISVRVVHKDGAGEEVINAEVIARIEEDVE